jgi:hypothetical protein
LGLRRQEPLPHRSAWLGALDEAILPLVTN